MSAGTTGPQAVGNTPAQKACAACGEKFSCSASAASCWCESVKLEPNTLSKLRARYSDCLCPRCLSAAQTNSGSEKSA
ncbi:MAG: cysteine-rich CWC family protein [Candidatus Acidiferrales bacterium]